MDIVMILYSSITLRNPHLINSQSAQKIPETIGHFIHIKFYLKMTQPNLGGYCTPLRHF